MHFPLHPETPAEGVTLEELFAHAATHAPAVLLARARASLSRADRVEASFTFPSNPVFGAAAGARVAGGQAGFDYELSLAQALELSGQQSSRRAAARASAEAAGGELDEVLWLTHVEAHRLAWLRMLAQRQRDQGYRNKRRPYVETHPVKGADYPRAQ